MTTIDKTGASDAEFRARVAAFDAAPTPSEVQVAGVARAILYAVLGDTDGGLVLDGDLPAAEIARLIAEYGAAAAIAALPPSPAEEVVKRVEALAEEWRYKGEFGWGAWQQGQGPDLEGSVLDQASADLRAALASPAPAPQGEEGQS